MVGVKEKDTEIKRERERKKCNLMANQQDFFFIILFYKKHQALIEKPFSHGHDVKAVMWSISSPGEATK